MPATAADAVIQLAALKADKSFTTALMSSAPSQLQRYRELREMIEVGTTTDVDMAMAGELMPGGYNTPEHLAHMGAASMLTEAGLRPELIKAVLTDKNVETPETKAQLKTFKADRYSDPEWVKRLMSGDAKARREFHLMAIIESSPIKSA